MGHHRAVPEQVSDEAIQVPTPPQPPARSRSRQVGLDMVRSMGLVAVVLVGWLLLSHPRTPDPVHVVAWQPVVQAAAESASYEVLAPPASWSWRATSARIEPQPDGTIVWRAGFYTPSDDYAAVLQRGVFPEQAAGSVREWKDTETRSGVSVGTVEINGRQWTRLEGDPHPDERRSLVHTHDGTLTVVTGSAQWSELEALARSLSVRH
jgi:hypothetical protein